MAFDSGRRETWGSLDFLEVLALQLGAGEKHQGSTILEQQGADAQGSCLGPEWRVANQSSMS